MSNKKTTAKSTKAEPKAVLKASAARTAEAKASAPKTRVLFVCTGNTCRSPMAEQIFKDYLKKKKSLSGFDVKSAGLYAAEGDSTSINTCEALKSFGIMPKSLASRQMDDKLYKRSDYIICMTAAHKAELLGQAADKVRTKGQKVFSVSEVTNGPDVPDPFGQSISHYKAVAEYLLYACEDIFGLLSKHKNKEGL